MLAARVADGVGQGHVEFYEEHGQRAEGGGGEVRCVVNEGDAGG